MAIWNTETSYGSVAKALHWLVVVIVIALLSAGFFMHDIENRALKSTVYVIHKSAGLSLLFLMLIRILWRGLNIRPAMPTAIPTWQRVAAHSTHAMLYIATIAMPLAGWIMSTAANKAPSFFWLFRVPMPGIPESKTLAGSAYYIHTQLAWLLIGLIVLHVLAALKHHYINRDDVLHRMLPW